MKDEIEENQNANADTTGAEKNENPEVVVTTEEVKENQQPSAQEVAFAFLKENGIEVNSIDDLKKVTEKVIEKVEVDTYDGLLDEDDKAYFNAKKINPLLNRKQFEVLNSNLDEIPKIDLARERVRKESGITLSNEQVDEYLIETLGIDLEDMSATDQVKLASYAKSILDEKKAEQEKYRTPVENKQDQNKDNSGKKEYVTLDGGAVMLKSDYDKLVDSRTKEIETAKVAVNSVTATEFKFTIDDNGTPIEQSYSYEYAEEDKHSMLSIVSDIDGVIASRYRSENGFNHKQFAEDMQWSDSKFREKAVTSLLNKAIAKNTEEILKLRGNVNFTNQEGLQQKTKDGVKMVSVTDALKGNY